MDASSLVELLRVGPFDAATLAQARSALTGPEAASLRAASPVAEDWSGLVVGFATACQEPTLASAAQRLAAELSDELGDDAAAAEHYAQALALDPSNAAVAKALVDRWLPAHATRLEATLSARTSALSKVPDIDDDQMAAAYRLLAEARWSTGDRDGAIEALDHAVDYDPELAATERLVEHYVARGNPGDDEQAADLLYAIADAVPDDQAVVYLGRALDLLPDHEESMVRLERLVPEADRTRKLRVRWVRYIERAGNDADADGRRLCLAKVLADESRYRDALLCIAPAADRGEPAAIELRTACLASLEGQAAREASPLDAPLTPKRALRARSGHTVLGLDLSAHRADGRVGEQRVLAPADPKPSERPSASSKLSPLDADPSPRSDAPGSAPVAATGASPLHPELRSSRPAAARDSWPLPAEHAVGAPTTGQMTGATRRPPQGPAQGPAGTGRFVLIAAAIVGLGVLLLLLRTRDPQPAPGATSLRQAELPVVADDNSSLPAVASGPASPRPLALDGPVNTAVAAKVKASALEATRAVDARALDEAPGQATAPTDKRASKPASDQAGAAVVRLGEDGVQRAGGKLPAWSIESDLERALPLFRGCYRSALARVPSLRGELIYSVEIGSDGRAREVQRRGGTIDDSNLIGCGASVLRGARFQPPERGSVQVRVPLVFGD